MKAKYSLTGRCKLQDPKVLRLFPDSLGNCTAVRSHMPLTVHSGHRRPYLSGLKKGKVEELLDSCYAVPQHGAVSQGRRLEVWAIRAGASEWAFTQDQSAKGPEITTSPALLPGQRALRQWSLVYHHPVKAELLHHLLELVEIHGLLNIAVDV
jgi:hypothetical protein